METRNPSNWSNLPLDIIISLFERLSFVDFHRAKMESSWEKMYFRESIPGKLRVAPIKRLCSERMEDRDREFEWELTSGSVYSLYADEIRGRLWVDEKTQELALVWFFDAPVCFLGFYKKGNAHYDLIRITYGIPRMLTGLVRLVLRGYRLYILTTRSFIRVIDFSRQQGFEELTRSDTYPSPTFAPLGYDCYFSIAVTTAGEVLLVTTSTTSESSERAFRIYKMDPNADQTTTCLIFLT
ncbi:PREDICTED: F-box protein At2g14290-like [Camelina sativa]|uniref:F-box protein At2g14290-like n=1 Tax=Camelina sativa TaxID=90675 RepID=A0ABM1QZX6_CAMSA|nr:PREDICTED: F-box protein At2g14290-like [Camelina sativa]